MAHGFSAGGLYNGLVLLIDDESGTYWDHITGEAVHGPLTGRRLETFGVEMTTAAAVLEHTPNLELHASSMWMARIDGWFLSRMVWKKGNRFPPGFRKTMGPEDSRLEAMTHGLGVVEDGRAKFYPIDLLSEGVQDVWGERILDVAIGAKDKIPCARWHDGADRPFQLFTRWYGFSFTYPACEIYVATDA